MRRYLPTLTIARRLLFWGFLASVLFYGDVLLGWYGLQNARESLREIHDEHQQAMLVTVEMDRLLNKSRQLVVLAFQLDPEGKLFRAHDKSLSTFLERIRSNEEKLKSLRQSIDASSMTETEQEMLAAFDEQYSIWHEDLEAMLELLEIEDFGARGMTLFLRVGAPAGESASEILSKLQEYQQEKTSAVKAEAETQFDVIVDAYIGLAVFGLLAGTATGVSTIRRLRRGFGEVTGCARAIADGDLSKALPTGGRDEVGQLLEELQRMQNGLRNLIGKIGEQVDVLGASSQTLTTDSRNSSDLARQQSEALTTISAAVEELSASIHEVEGHGEATRKTVEQATVRSEESELSINQMISEMESMSSAVGSTANQLKNLESLSEQIGSVIAVINEVAEQTNLLSLNAAIEAARAGDHGRGFAVVAGEVRGLAERTSESTVEISRTIQHIRQATAEAVKDMESTVARVSGGVESAQRAGEAVRDIRAGTQDVILAVNEISEVLTNQSATTRSIALEVEAVVSGVKEMSESAERSSGSAEKLNQLASELRQQSGRFRLA